MTSNIEYAEEIYYRDEEFGECLEVFNASMPESEASQQMCPDRDALTCPALRDSIGRY